MMVLGIGLDLVERLGACQVVAEGFFDDEPAPAFRVLFLRQAGFAQLSHDFRIELRRHGDPAT